MYSKRQLENTKRINDILMPIKVAIDKFEEYGPIISRELDLDIESMLEELDSINSALKIALITIIENPENK